MSPDVSRAAIVTGASSGIGRAVALELARSGWRLGLVGRDAGRLAQVAQECGGDVHIAAIDMQDSAAFAGFVAEFGAVDLLISNHGILDGRRNGQMVESAEVARDVVAINLQSVIGALHAVLPGMQARGKGQIAIVSSLAGLSPLPDAPAYSASKAGLVMYGLSLREALRGSGVGVSVCCPGYVATPMGGEHLGNRPHEISAQDAARRIVKSALANKRLFGFPAPLWPMALFSLLIPEGLLRLFNGDLRFTVAKR
ncbi:SDR family NAD(P)-dependent oxidoreductase [Novosphingobium humi]|uniref:SDR family NAD(P)-dependent oxidoreductase n=1 Tax=Novosphingobium humi TaxID=2282397 RepID=A0ABY7TVT5_9SPHN|nr:SDR family NAD(P)-dependent oxidoreductase [Novosphingobium humi]WCT77360.1 SDR family NAD(P)-dependent oxidoreductase [Novosphingobium humi]WJS99117.1 SDR family NAD(P)-dependent oxidoreductase [Novosphingobium humi]